MGGLHRGVTDGVVGGRPRRRDGQPHPVVRRAASPWRGVAGVGGGWLAFPPRRAALTVVGGWLDRAGVLDGGRRTGRRIHHGVLSSLLIFNFCKFGLSVLLDAWR